MTPIPLSSGGCAPGQGLVRGGVTRRCNRRRTGMRVRRVCYRAWGSLSSIQAAAEARLIFDRYVYGEFPLLRLALYKLMT